MKARMGILMVLCQTLATMAIPTAWGAEPQCKLRQLAQLPVVMRDKKPTIEGKINGQPAWFLLDSGAFYSFVYEATVEKYGMKHRAAPFGFSVTGVGGTANVAIATADGLSISGWNVPEFRKVEFLALSGDRWDGRAGIIGQNILGFKDTEYDLANAQVRLFAPKDCKKVYLAYWVGNQDASDIPINPTTPSESHVITQALLNGKKIRVLLDTGAGYSFVTKDAAIKVGMKPDSSRVTVEGVISGIGGRGVDVAVAKFDELVLGGEKIRHAKLRIVDVSRSRVASADMVLGMDFFLSHRIYVANSQDRLYFTYNGGPVFDLGNGDDADSTDDDRTDSPASNGDAAASVSAQTVDVPALRRQGATLAAREDFVGAVAKLDEAIRAKNDDPELYLERAKFLWYGGQGERALQDYDHALKIRPDSSEARLQRGQFLLAQKQLQAAQQDLALLPPGDSRIDLKVASSYGYYGYHEQAVTVLDRWISTNSKHLELINARLMRCQSLVMMNARLDEALSDCDAAIKRHGDSFSLGYRGLVWIRNQNYDKAAKDFNAALKLQPKNVLALYGLGVALRGQNQAAMAEKTIQDAEAISLTEVTALRNAGF